LVSSPIPHTSPLRGFSPILRTAALALQRAPSIPLLSPVVLVSLRFAPRHICVFPPPAPAQEPFFRSLGPYIWLRFLRKRSWIMPPVLFFVPAGLIFTPKSVPSRPGTILLYVRCFFRFWFASTSQLFEVFAQSTLLLISAPCSATAPRAQFKPVRIVPSKLFTPKRHFYVRP